MSEKHGAPDAAERRRRFREALKETSKHLIELEEAAQADELRPAEIEPLNCYSILTNDDGQILLVLPGYFRGEPEVAELLYNGHSHAILVRNKGQCVVCDELNPQIRELVPKNESILVFEVDSKRRYTARVLRKDIDEIAAEAVRLHDYEFLYHPFPVLDGTFRTDGAKCDYCGNSVKIYYRGVTEKGQRKTICPACIDGMAPDREDDGLFPGLEEACRESSGTLFGDTPPYLDHGKPGTLWASHCGEPSVYLGRLDALNFTKELQDELQETWEHRFNRFREDDPQDIFKEFLEGDMTAHLFRCARCRKLLAVFYERGDDCGYDIALSALYRKIQEVYGDSFTETWFKLTAGEDGSARITEMVGDRGYHTVIIDPDGNILTDGGFDLVREWKEDRLRVRMDWEKHRSEDA